jgi:hypothetical protein
MGNKEGHYHQEDYSTAAYRHDDYNAASSFSAIPDRYRTYEELQRALRNCGMEVCELIIGTIALLVFL